MEKHVDVVVVGLGNGGLSAAMTALSGGLKTLCIERHNIPGGAATSFVRGRFEFEASLHEACNIGEPGNRDIYGGLLESLGADVDWICDRHLYHCIIPDAGIDASMPCGRDAFLDELEKHVPGCRPSVENYFKACENANAGFRYMVEHVPPNFFEGTPRAMVQKLQHDVALNSIKAVLATRYPDFLRMTAITTQECLNLFEIPKKAQIILTQYWGYLGGKPKVMDAFTMAFLLFQYMEGGAWLPRMKSHGLSLAQDKAIRDKGGEIWYDTAVKEMIVKNGRVVGVRTDKWDVYAREVICNIHPHIVLGNMMKNEDIPQQALKYYNSKKIAVALYTVYLGLDCTAEELGVKDYSNMISLKANVDELEDSMHSNEDNGYCILNCSNVFVPDASPEGTCNLFLTGGFYGDVMNGVKPEDYRAFKEKAANRLIDISEKYLNIDIRSHIEEIVIACPPTFVRYMGQPNGTPYGYQITTNTGFGQNCMNEIEMHQIPGLHFCGSTGILTDGYISACVSGNFSAQYVVDKIAAEDYKTNTRAR